MPIYDPSTHDDLVSVTVTLGLLSSGVANFSTILMIVDGVTPGGGTYATYSSVAEVTADIANLNTIAQSMATAAFAQARPPASIIIIGIDTGSSDTYADGLAAAVAAGLNFYGVVADSRTPAQQIVLATAVEAAEANGQRFLLFLQDDDADWLTSGIPSAWSAVSGYERTVICYHDDNDNDAGSDRLDVALAARMLSFDADLTSCPATIDVSGVDALATALTSTQKGFARANYANTALPKGTLVTTFVDPGKTLAGRPADHIVSADWLAVRIAEAGNDKIAAVAAQGRKLVVDPQGQAELQQAIEAKFIQAVDAGHLTTTDPTKPPYRLTAQTITSADIAAQRVRFSAEGQFATGIRQVPISLYLSADAIS